MPPQSLRQLCTATAIRNVKYLNDIGNIPYTLARPFLLKIESPEKLRSLELNSPHLMRDDVELWLEFIKRDIPKWDEISLPEQSDCWYDIYCELQEQVQRAVDEDAEKLKMALDGISSERAKHSAKFVTDRRTLPLPRERPTAKQRYASFDRKMGGIAPVFSSKSGTGSPSDPMGSPLWSFERPSVPRSQGQKKNNRNIFNATKRNPALAVPTQHLNNRATQIRQAPRSLIEQHRRPPDPPVAQRPTLRAPGRSSLAGVVNNRSQTSPAIGSSLQEREARLRAIASGHTPTSSPSRVAPQLSSSSSSARPSSSSLRTAPRSHFRTTSVANTEDYRSSESGTNTDAEESKMSPPRVATIRKRPAPNVFIQPKKKKLT
ncbi:RNA polymerase II transcription factor SIII subunit A-domain-containing protein [Aspergillus cavernicola]|uniref:RNA polymerase II transcription factor SIII subunit A-domain-containing protein n=1 Tax=Aspergillus cavernicola TaxID=176166 RepID=A0ABR4IYS5_9EURO